MLFRHPDMSRPPKEGEPTLAELPLDLFIVIAEYVNLADVIALSMVCTTFKNSLTNQSFWYRRSKREFPFLDAQHSKVADIDWRQSVLSAFKNEVSKTRAYLRSNKETPILIDAITLGVSSHAMRLIDLGFGVQRVDRHKLSPLFHAVNSPEPVKIIKSLIKAGVDWREALQDALKRDHVKVVVALVNIYKNDLVFPSEIQISLDKWHENNLPVYVLILPALVIALWKANAELVDLIISGEIPAVIEHCVATGNLSVITALLIPGYGKFSCNVPHDMKLLTIAAEQGCVEMAEAILANHHAIANALNEDGNTGYQVACHYQQWKVATIIALAMLDQCVRKNFLFQGVMRPNIEDGDVLRSLRYILKYSDSSKPISDLLAEKKEHLNTNNEHICALIKELAACDEGMHLKPKHNKLS